MGEQFVKRLCAEGGVLVLHHSLLHFWSMIYILIVSTDAPSGVGGEAKERRGLLQPAKKAFSLACIEQLVPILSDNSLPMVFQTCFPYVRYSNRLL
jgi:hypothetical protein